jgi:hypothetical protein
MKTNRTYRKGFAALALILTLAACTDLAGPGTGSGETIPPGMGLVRIRLGLGGPAQSIQSVRTAHPDISAYDHFDLEFTAPGKEPVSETLGSTSGSVLLEPAVWNLKVEGYVNLTDSTPAISGNVSVPITAGMESSFDVYLTPDFSSGGTGTLDYSIDIPNEVTRAFLSLYPIDDTPGLSQEIDISASAGGTATAVSYPLPFPSLPVGSYRVVIDLYNSTANTAAVWTGAVHIYESLATPLTHSFTATDFADCPPPPTIFPVENTLAAKLDAALDSPAGSYTIVLDGTETDLTSFTPKDLSVATGNKIISITIRGNGETVRVANTGTPLFTLSAFSGSLSLTIQDLTLQGPSGNTSSLVRVNNMGTLLMKAGSLITDNSGSGVIVDSGTFTMSGGAVSGNIGGVAVSSNGIFTMNGGAVSGNSSSADGSESGVGVSGSGTFTMNGGAVSGNTVDDRGGGVYMGGGTFTMNGGAVSGNTAGYGGGGVYMAGGTFTMNGGAVNGNTGGGVSVGTGTFTMNEGMVSDNTGSGVSISNGTFTMSKGMVSGNTAISGGGVYVGSNGTFIMSGGAVNGNTASSFGGGVAVSSNGTFSMSGGAVNGNLLSGASSYGREVLLSTNGTFNISGDARPERVFLYNNALFIIISGLLNDGITTHIDLGITSTSGSGSLTGWVGKQILQLDGSYSGNLASLKDHFILGNATLTASISTETVITGYKIDDDGLFVEDN